jgi:hypothetical protein
MVVEGLVPGWTLKRSAKLPDRLTSLMFLWAGHKPFGKSVNAGDLPCTEAKQDAKKYLCKSVAMWDLVV